MIFNASNGMKLVLVLLALCSINLYLVNCEYNPNSSNEIDMDRISLEDLENSDEGADGDLKSFQSLSTKTKIKLLEFYLNELKRKEFLESLSGSFKKRSSLRSMNDRKRPGWELAYGRRKRAL